MPELAFQRPYHVHYFFNGRNPASIGCRLQKILIMDRKLPVCRFHFRPEDYDPKERGKHTESLGLSSAQHPAKRPSKVRLSQYRMEIEC